ncbi:MAG: MBL fold metallo-hydrolase [Candidatus Delongbacteria bacterium]|nr:MBL fold metallo-hydrolase [Candidatus Delongbacteria bacterium]
MKVKFWGVRGSIPAPFSPDYYKSKVKEILLLALKKDLSNDEKINDFINELPIRLRTTYGGNTSCVTITTEEISIILDAGTGLRLLGKEIEEGKFINPTNDEYYLFLSHLHWDHINGLPFFAPLHSGNKKINFYSVHKNYQQILSDQQNAHFFPVSLESRPAEKEFHLLQEEKEILVGDLKIVPKKLDHPNDSYAFKVTDKNGFIVIYATDGEYRVGSDINSLVEFYKDADILIFDSQYSSDELIEKTGFGHSSSEIGIDIAVRSNVKKIIFFHHNHDHNDKMIEDNLYRSIKYLEKNHPNNKLKIATANENSEYQANLDL